MFLRQSTAVTIQLGQFVDAVDGGTPETALTISQADVRLSKNGGAFAQKNEATAATHSENGYYSVPLNTTDTNTVGHLLIAVTETGSRGAKASFQVLEEAVYDALFAASAVGPVLATTPVLKEDIGYTVTTTNGSLVTTFSTP